MKSILTTLFLIILFPCMVIFFVANSHSVTVNFDPTSLENSAAAFTKPLYFVLSGMLFVGFILGAIGMWISTTRLRQRAGDAKKRIRELEREVQLAKEQARTAPGGTNLPALRS